MWGFSQFNVPPFFWPTWKYLCSAWIQNYRLIELYNRLLHRKSFRFRQHWLLFVGPAYGDRMQFDSEWEASSQQAPDRIVSRMTYWRVKMVCTAYEILVSNMNTAVNDSLDSGIVFVTVRWLRLASTPRTHWESRLFIDLLEYETLGWQNRILGARPSFSQILKSV